ncbi:Chromatin structure remodeling complex protein sfh1 [Thoreauomyces humboldtii]|nr:Chromatin structure remodeling complex protein sfh1 [Thoreauomyces humboldtii]
MNSHMPGNLMSQSAPPVQFMPQHGRSNSMNNVGHSIVTSGMMGQQQHQQQQQRGSPMMTQQQMLSQPGKAKKDWRSKNPPNPQLLNTQIHQMLNSLPPAAESTSPPPPSTHRGFGASARQYNCDGSASVSEFRLKWRCRWCLCSGKYTPALRKGPLGAKTLCNACGMWYNRHGFLPQERYREHAGGNQGGAGSATGSGPNTDSDSGTPTVPKLEMPILSPLNTTSMPMMLASPGVSSPTSPDSPYGSSFQDHHLHHRRLHEPSSDMRRPPHPPVSHLQRHPSVTGTSGPRYPHSPPLPAGAAAAASQLHQMGYSSAGGSLSSAGHMQHQQQQHQRQQQQQQSLMQQMDTYQHVGQQQQPPPDLDFQDPNDDWLFGTSQGAAGTAQVSTSMPVVRRPGGW